MEVDAFVEEINAKINDIVGKLVRKEHAISDGEILDHYHKILKVKIIKDDFEPYKRRLRRRYLTERKRKIKEIRDNHKRKLDELKKQIKEEMNDDQEYVDQLQDIYGIKLAEHKRAVYYAYIKKASTKSYAEFLKNVVHKAFYTTLSTPAASTWRMQLMNRNSLFDDNTSASSISCGVMIGQIGNITVPAEFVIFYSKFIPYTKNNKKYLEEVVKKVNKQVEIVNHVCTEMSCFHILRDVLVNYHNKNVENMITNMMNWHDRYKVQIRDYVIDQNSNRNDGEEGGEGGDTDEEEDDIYDERLTFRRTLKAVDQLIYKTFEPMNKPAFLARTYFNVTDMNNPMMYLALTESSYDIVYNLYLEFLLLVLVYQINLRLGLGLGQVLTPFCDVINAFQELESVKYPLTISQMVPGLIVLIIMHIQQSGKCPEALVLFRHDINKIKRRDEIRRYLVDLALVMIRFVVELIHDPTTFLNLYGKDLLTNAKFIKCGIPT